MRPAAAAPSPLLLLGRLLVGAAAGVEQLQRGLRVVVGEDELAVEQWDLWCDQAPGPVESIKGFESLDRKGFVEPGQCL